MTYLTAMGTHNYLVRMQTPNLFNQIGMVSWHIPILRMALTRWAMLLLKSDAILR